MRENAQAAAREILRCERLIHRLAEHAVDFGAALGHEIVRGLRLLIARRTDHLVNAIARLLERPPVLFPKQDDAGARPALVAEVRPAAVLVVPAIAILAAAERARAFLVA